VLRGALQVAKKADDGKKKAKKPGQAKLKSGASAPSS
jgi:hypothetical protein